jgi:glycosyltransferase involved in cell wall biosynthesis
VSLLPEDLHRTRLAIAGAPSLVPEHGERLRNMARELLGERAVFLGPRDDVPDLLRASDAFVLASSLEGLPLSVLEAQSCGTPVVAYPTAGIPEVVTDGETGLLARAGDPQDLARRLAELLHDPSLRERLSAQGRARVLAESTLQGQADQQARLLEDVVARRSRRRS